MSQPVLVQTTTSSRQDAERLAEVIIQHRLGGCVQIVGPILSVYRWQDAVQKEDEFLVSIKTVDRAFAPLSQLIREHHSYDVPEIILLPIQDGSRDYLDWLKQQVITE